LANLSGQLHSSDAAHRLDRTAPEVLTFFADRLKVQQREAGVRHDLIDAVFALGGEDDLVRLLARVKALQEFVGTDDGTNLLVPSPWGNRAVYAIPWSGLASGSAAPARTYVPGQGGIPATAVAFGTAIG